MHKLLELNDIPFKNFKNILAKIFKEEKISLPIVGLKQKVGEVAKFFDEIGEVKALNI